MLIWGVVLLLALGAVGLKWPRGFAYPLGVLLLWLPSAGSFRPSRLWRRRERSLQAVKQSSLEEDAA